MSLILLNSGQKETSEAVSVSVKLAGTVEDATPHVRTGGATKAVQAIKVKQSGSLVDIV